VSLSFDDETRSSQLECRTAGIALRLCGRVGFLVSGPTRRDVERSACVACHRSGCWRSGQVCGGREAPASPDEVPAAKERKDHKADRMLLCGLCVLSRPNVFEATPTRPGVLWRAGPHRVEPLGRGEPSPRSSARCWAPVRIALLRPCSMRGCTVIEGEVFEIGEGRGWTCRLELHPQERWERCGRVTVRRTVTRPCCVCRLQIGARVASPQSPILRWSKVRVSRVRYRGGLEGGNGKEGDRRGGV
jgi:hypothetical protein